MKCCAFRMGTVTEIRYDMQHRLTFITFATDVSNIYTSFILIVSDTTLVMDEFYNEISIDDLQVGDLIGSYHSPIMTMSIPPQSQAFIIELK
ncbi:hypothetical protein [Romboutsia sp. 1001713B170207_170306_H8]|uniref:hypothetical protein n=1 Tax=Romboutsia sp. 1001713B170207_170306_H8 TaxID=2787112 RepID=UPI0008231CD1|nr:hypothetical protein [Romboutsia sp. 1001713B170207_170306_H8]SCH42252.1 Uncharacterised protein [uncultured Clostridium sp.]